MIGFFGYDLAPRIERLPRAGPARLASAGYPPGALRHGRHGRRRSGRVELWAWDLTGEGRTAAERRCRSWRKALDRGVPFGQTDRRARRRRWLGHRARSTARPTRAPCAGFWNTSRPATCSRSICRNGSRPAADTDPLDLYLRLKEASPAPFAAFLHWKDLAVVSASPESFYQTRGDISGDPADQGNPAARQRRPTTTPGSPPSCSPHPRTAPS